MLLDQAKDISAKIGDYTRLKSNVSATKEFETRASQLPVPLTSSSARVDP